MWQKQRQKDMSAGSKWSNKRENEVQTWKKRRMFGEKKQKKKYIVLYIGGSGESNQRAHSRMETEQWKKPLGVGNSSRIGQRPIILPMCGDIYSGTPKHARFDGSIKEKKNSQKLNKTSHKNNNKEKDEQPHQQHRAPQVHSRSLL